MSGGKYKSVVLRKFYICLLWSAFIIWSCLCLYLSWQSGDETVGLSEKITLFAIRILSSFGLKIEFSAFHTFLRASAHFALFFVAGILCGCSFRQSFAGRGRIGRGSPIISASICVILAVAAEVGKLWIPGRHLEWDILLNILGSVCSVIIIHLIIFVKARKRGTTLLKAKQTNSNKT